MLGVRILLATGIKTSVLSAAIAVCVVAVCVQAQALNPANAVGTAYGDRALDNRLSASRVSTAPALPVPAVSALPAESYNIRASPFARPGRFVRYRLSVTNWQAYPADLFVSAPDLPPCGRTTQSSRTWVDIYDATTNRRIRGFCAFSSPADLQSIWFTVKEGSVPPQAVYVVLKDRRTGKIYRSNVVRLPASGRKQ